MPTLLHSIVLVWFFAPPLLAQSLPPYPETRRVDQIDAFHEEKVADPYRWLEDETAADTAAWVQAQMRVTQAYFDRLPFQAALKERLTQLLDFPRFTVPEQRGDRIYYRSNPGLLNQSLVVQQVGLDGAPETVLDPNALSADGTTSLNTFSLQPSGQHAAYTLSQGGSDWLEIRVMDLATKTTLADRLEWVKVTGIAWHGEGFYYSRYPVPAEGRTLSAKNEDHQVWYHRVGTPQSADELVHRNAANLQSFHTVDAPGDGRFAVLYVSDRGKGKRGNAFSVRDLAAEEKAFHPVVAEVGDASFTVLGHVDGKLVVSTDHGAPNGRVLLIDPKTPAEANWTTLRREGSEPLRSVSLAGGRLFVTVLKDVVSHVEVYRLDGALERNVVLPGLGTVRGFEGCPETKAVFYSYTSFDAPSTLYHYDIASGRSSVFREPAIPGYQRGAFETRQVFVTSRDGTRVPMFLVHRKGLKADGSNATLLYGYGGFNVSMLPSFSALRLALLEQGVVYALANIRGGGEYGQAWHHAGSRLKKQNTFDDFIAAAEWLQHAGITRPDKLTIQGGSNGGLLVGAVMNQRPELFAAAVPQVGVMDMLRFHQFTIGWNWVADYGSVADPAEYKVLRAISPLHNLKPGTRYPSTLITTADRDDRVVPAHSFKYAAALQAALADTKDARPALIRIETKSGHGSSNTSKLIDSVADVYGFLFNELGVRPRWAAAETSTRIPMPEAAPPASGQ